MNSPRLAFVLWSGQIGGAETFTASLAEAMRARGVDVTLAFVTNPHPLARRLAASHIPYYALHLSRGRGVLRHPRKLASWLSRIGPAGALLVERGFLSSTLRVGGYRSPIVAVEHGPLLFESLDLSLPRRVASRIDRGLAIHATDAEVAVSDFMLAELRRHRHGRRTLRIYNGIDPLRFPVLPEPAGDDLVIGLATRLIPGKGADVVIRAVQRIADQLRVRLLIAGDGPDRSCLQLLARDLGVASQVDFLGVLEDTTGFWCRCNVAAITPDAFVESFSMTTLEAMASARAIVATRNGAIPELIVDGRTGTLVGTGDVAGLATALLRYGRDPELRRAHACAARARARSNFHIGHSAERYWRLFSDLASASVARHGGF